MDRIGGVAKKETVVNKHLPPTHSHMPTGGVHHFGEHVLDDGHGDPYQVKGKYREPTVCSDCHAAYHEGRWTWDTPAEQAAEARCPACRRVRDKMPAGTLVLEGPFVEAHLDEIVQLVRNEAERERLEHPLHRVMEIANGPRRIQVATTDIHLPQRLGEAVRRAFDGDLTVKYGPDDYCARAHWRR